MKEKIRSRALELGFDLCRFTDASPPPHAEAFRRWIEAGCHGTMQYLARNAEKRVDPGKVLENARSIVLVASSYQHPEPTCGPTSAPTAEGGVGPRGVVARYAHHQDYHDVLGARLATLASDIDQSFALGHRTLWYVDTGPFLERDLAERAGLGFVGKHTSLISRELGNWFFIGLAVTTLELPPDGPERNRCGSCTRCITACPTDAIVAPFSLDVRKCISYLTIELKGSIPVELRPAIGTRIFGCDDCLAACPWNRFAREGAIMREYRRQDLATPSLEDWLSLDDAAFKSTFAGTPILRLKRRGLLRNICVALGNAGDLSVLPALERATTDKEALIREHAAWAIGTIRNRLHAPPPQPAT